MIALSASGNYTPGMKPCPDKGHDWKPMYDNQLFETYWCAACGCMKIVRHSNEKGTMTVIQTPTYERGTLLKRLWRALRGE